MTHAGRDECPASDATSGGCSPHAPRAMLSRGSRPTRRTGMAVMTEGSADTAPIRPFTIETPEADLDDLRARIAATRWPERETVDDQSQGVPLATMQTIARYWH